MCDEPVNRGRLFKLKLKRNRAAREDALATVRRRPDGAWQARVGGRVRGRWLVFRSEAEARQAVREHYDRAMFEHVTGGGRCG